MTRKIKTATLEKFELPTRWLVLQVTDSLQFSPGDYLDQSQVQQLVNSDNWKIRFIKADLR